MGAEVSRKVHGLLHSKTPSNTRNLINQTFDLNINESNSHFQSLFKSLSSFNYTSTNESTFLNNHFVNTTNSKDLNHTSISTNILGTVVQTLMGSSQFLGDSTSTTAIPLVTPDFQFPTNPTDFVSHSPSDDHQGTNIVMNIFVMAIAVPVIILTLFGNLLVLLVWLTHRPFRTPSNLYLISLAFADFLTSILLVFAVHSQVMHTWSFGLLACQVWLVNWHILNTATALHLVAIAVDRYRILTEGVSYLQRRSFKSVREKLYFIWILSAWVMSPLVFDWEHLSMDPMAKESCVSRKTPFWIVHFSCASFWFPAAFLINIYYKVHQEIKRRMALLNYRGRSINDPSSEAKISDKEWVGESPSCVTSTSEDQVQDTTFDRSRKAESLKARERRSLVTMTIISGGFILCLLPWNLASLYEAFRNPLTSSLNDTLYTATVVIGQGNCFINPIIYAARIPEFRAALNILWNKLRGTSST